jgi:hypothetical protein
MAFKAQKDLVETVGVLKIQHARRQLFDRVLIQKLMELGIPVGTCITALREAHKAVSDADPEPKFKPYSETDVDEIPF